MKTEAILGNAVHEGRRLNVPTPRLEAIYALMKMLEAKLDIPYRGLT
jgi:2-dehydropantoate 2-reductase